MKHRMLTLQAPELREDPAGPPSLAGYAAVFDQETVIGGWFRERVAPGAFTRALAERDDVVALFNHSPDLVLGRTTNGTLVLAQDDHGLRYTVTLNPDDPDAQRVLAKVRRADVVASSFAFDVQDDEIVREDDKLPLRIIRSVRLYDVSPVTYPAYPTTSVMARSAEDDAAVRAAIARQAEIDPAAARRRYAGARAGWTEVA